MARIANKGAVAEMEQSARQVFHHFHFITLSFSLPVLIAIQEEEKFLFFVVVILTKQGSPPGLNELYCKNVGPNLST